MLNYIKPIIAKMFECNNRFVSILTFHSVGGAFPFSVNHSEVKVFLHSLQLCGDFIGLDQLSIYLEPNNTIKNNLFVLTFDDGHVDNYYFALNVLAEEKIPATFFVGTGLISGDSATYINDVAASRGLKLEKSDFMNTDMIMDLHSKGFLIQPHGQRHLPFTTRDSTEIRKDIETTIECFTKYRIDPRFFAIPFGRVGKDFTPQHVSIVRDSGLQPLSISPTVIKFGEKLPLCLPRVGLGNADKNLWHSKAFGAGRLWKALKEPFY